MKIAMDPAQLPSLLHEVTSLKEKKKHKYVENIMEKEAKYIYGHCQTVVDFLKRD